MKKLTVQDLLALKGKRQLTEVYVDTVDQAVACEAAGIDMIVTSASIAKEVREAAPNIFMVLPVLKAEAAVSDSEAIRHGINRLQLGADAVYTPVGFDRVKAMTKEYIPVIGHVGLVPSRCTWTGGFVAVGKTKETALKVYEDTMAYEEAGAIGVEMEVVPAQVAEEISKRVKLLCISMGSGSNCDAQYLFASDILGSNTGHVPRHAKTYRNFAAEYERLNKEAAAAFSEFKSDVDSGIYPEAKHCVNTPGTALQEFLDTLGNKN